MILAQTLAVSIGSTITIDYTYLKFQIKKIISLLQQPYPFWSDDWKEYHCMTQKKENKENYYKKYDNENQY